MINYCTKAHPIDCHLSLTVSGQTVKQYYYKAYRNFYLRPIFIRRHIFAIPTLPEMLM